MISDCTRNVSGGYGNGKSRYGTSPIAILVAFSSTKLRSHRTVRRAFCHTTTAAVAAKSASITKTSLLRWSQPASEIMFESVAPEAFARRSHRIFYQTLGAAIIPGGLPGGQPGGVVGGIALLLPDNRVHIQRDKPLPMKSIRQEYPTYPEEGRLKMWEDNLTVRYVIGKDGRVKEITIIDPPHRS